jgi:hypothetical protein
LSGLKIQAHVLTLLPGRVFQVFQVAGEKEETENREFIDNLFTSIISVHIYFNASPPPKHKQYLVSRSQTHVMGSAILVQVILLYKGFQDPKISCRMAELYPYVDRSLSKKAYVTVGRLDAHKSAGQ